MIERITITRHGDDDYSVYFSVADFSVRGTYAEVMDTVHEYATTELTRSNGKAVKA